MKLSDLLKGIEYKTSISDIDKIEIEDITCNSNEVKKNSLFSCIKGANSDGHDYYSDALKKGAAVILCQNDLNIDNQIIVKDSRYAFSKMVENFEGNPAKNLKFIGITGTNGKTTITKLIKTVLDRSGYKSGLIGTIQNEINDKVVKTDKTTPDPKDYQKLLKEMVKEDCDYVVMEVSSHALEQRRLADTKFEIAAFTNLTQDHLDYHKTMEEYYKAKKKLFKITKNAIISIDDDYGKQLYSEINCNKYSISIKDSNADYKIDDIKTSIEGVSYRISGFDLDKKIKFKTPGLFSVYNSAIAFLTLKILGLDVDDIVNKIQETGSVKGRSEIIKTGRDFSIICDYAHSEDGLINILSSINSYKKARVITLFGCGGDRDKTKRPKMGKAAAQHSDFLIVTSDNPRTEDPDKIIDDIIPGIEETNTEYVRITNRKEAIEYAIKNAKKDDIILLAGKGHEDYQVIGKEKIDFDERVIVEEILKKQDR